MRRLVEKLTELMAAVAFAEEGDAETARAILAEADAEPEERRDAEGGARGPSLPTRPRRLAKST